MAPPETNKGKSQRAILDFRSKLAAFTKGDSDSSDEDDLPSLAEQMGATSPRTAESRADDDAIFDPDRQRLTGGATRAGSRFIAQRQASMRGIRGMSRSYLLHSPGSGNGRRPRGRMSLLGDEGNEG